MTERAQNADFRRKPLIFADSPFLLEIEAFGGRRKLKIFAEDRRKPQIGLRHLRCITFRSALNLDLLTDKPVHRKTKPKVKLPAHKAVFGVKSICLVDCLWRLREGKPGHLPNSQTGRFPIVLGKVANSVRT